MYQIEDTALFLEYLQNTVLRFRTEVSWSYDLRTWHRLENPTGSVTCDRGSETRWTATIAAEKPDDYTGLLGLTPFGARVRIRRIITIPRIREYVIPWGIYRIDKITDGPTDVNLELYGLEKAIQDARFPKPRKIGGRSLKYTVEKLVTEAVPDTEFIWRIPNDEKVAKIIEERERWALLDGGVENPSLAKAFSCEMFYDGRGRFVVANVPTVADPIDWNIGSSIGGIVVTPSRSFSREGLFNVAVAVGEVDGKPVGPGYAWDKDPGSLTYAGPDPIHHPELAGPFGVVPVFHSSPFIRKQVRANEAAKTVLANSMGISQTVAFTTISNPLLEAGDIIRLDKKKHIVDKWTGDLSSAFMTCDTRSVRLD